MIVKLRSAEYEDHRPIYINVDWIKWFIRFEKDPGTIVTNIIVGDGYATDDYPVEMVPVLETPEEIFALCQKSHETN